MAQDKHDRAELESIIARTALKYDLLPYESNPFPQSHPHRMGAMAKLFGLEPVPLGRARVLELGCAAGGNLIPHAFRNPGATFVGVDLSRTQVAAGRARIAHLGLENVKIHCRSLTELDEAVGQFDYIICHGVYSWVPAPVREEILRISQERLAPGGVAYISYNVLPGWRMLQALRDAFLLEIPDQNDSRRRVAQARQFLAFLKDTVPAGSAYQKIIAGEELRFAGMSDDYIAHEFLEEVNEPCTFKEFLEQAGRRGLAYLGDADLPSMILDNQPAETARRVRERVGNNLAATEQCLDYITGRTFRQTLLVHAGRQAEIDRGLVPGRIRDLHFLAAADLKHERQREGCIVSDSKGRSLATKSPIVAEAMEHMVKRFPASFSVDSLTGLLSAPHRTQESGRLVCGTLFDLVRIGLAHAMLDPACLHHGVSDKPVACPLVRSDAARGERSTANLRHEPVRFDPVARAILPRMDGTRGHAALADAMAAEVLAGRLRFTQDGQPVTDKNLIAATARERIPRILAGCARAALLVG